MNVLITGGYGFIGSHVAERFHREGYKVYIIDNLTTGSPNNVTFPHKLYHLHVQDKQCEEVFRSGKFDVVVHLAGQTNVKNSDHKPQEDVDANLVGLVNMLHLAHKYSVRKFIYASSIEVYGHKDQGLITEEVECEPITPYGLNKYVGEKYCTYWQEKYGLETICLRLSYVIGPRQTKMCESGWMIETIEKFFLAQEVEGGRLTKYFDLIYVADVADAIYRVALTQHTGVYNLCSGQRYTIGQVLDILAKIEKRTDRPVNQNHSINEKSITVDCTKARKSFDWVPLYSLEEALTLTYQWFVEYVHASRTKKQKWYFPKLKKYLPYLENGLFFFVIATLTLSQIRLLENLLLDYSMIYIFVMGMLYGIRHAMIAVILSSMLELINKLVVGRELFSLFFDAQYLFTITLYVGIGLIVGYFTDSRKQEQKWLKQQLEDSLKRYQFLREVYQDTCEIKEKLQEQLMKNRDGIARNYRVMTMLDHREPEEVIAASIDVLEEWIEGGKFSYYTVSKDSTLNRIIYSAHPCNDGLRTLEIDFDFKQHIEGKRIFINRKLQPYLPLMAAPIFHQEKMIGIITIDELDYEQINYTTENRFRICADMLSRFLTKALDYVELKPGRRYFEGTKILKEETFVQILECKGRAKQKEQLDYELIELPLLSLSPREFEAMFQSYLRECDYIGQMNQSYAILLTNPDEEKCSRLYHVIGQLAISDENRRSELSEGKLIYV